MEKVSSHHDFISRAGNEKRSFLLLYKPGSQQSDCAFTAFSKAFEPGTEVKAFYADVTEARDIHPAYDISSVPALLVFREDKLVNIIKGCHDQGYYTALSDNSIFQAEKAGAEKAARRVIVYSTPTCSWCTTLKAWLQKNNIRYTDVDVSRDQKAAEDLVKRSGQQGVPQTDINGQIVVGFNQPRLKELLGIN